MLTPSKRLRKRFDGLNIAKNKDNSSTEVKKCELDLRTNDISFI